MTQTGSQTARKSSFPVAAVHFTLNGKGLSFGPGVFGFKALQEVLASIDAAPIINRQQA